MIKTKFDKGGNFLKKINYSVHLKPFKTYYNSMIVDSKLTKEQIWKAIENELDFDIDFDEYEIYDHKSNSDIIEEDLKLKLNRDPTYEDLLLRYRQIVNNSQ